MSKTDLNHIEQRLQDKADVTIQEFLNEIDHIIDKFHTKYDQHAHLKHSWKWQYRDIHGTWKCDNISSGSIAYLKGIIRENIRAGYRDIITDYYAKDLVKKLEVL